MPENISAEDIVRGIADQRCPWCGATHTTAGKRLTSLGVHVHHAHDITAYEMKVMAGFRAKDRACSPEVSVKLRKSSRGTARYDIEICPACRLRPRRLLPSGAMDAYCVSCASATALVSQKTPKGRARRAKWMREHVYRTPEYRARDRARVRSPEAKARRAEQQRERRRSA